MKKRRNSYQKTTVGPNDTSKSGRCKISKRSKIEKCVDCFSAHGTHSEKKCDTWAKAMEGNRTLTLSIPTMLILTFRILCVDKIGSPGGLGVVEQIRERRHPG